MKRLPFIAGNWKMNKTVEESLELVRALRASLKDIRDVEVAVAPPFTALHSVSQELKGSSIHLASQNLFWEEKGAFTGEISPVMLKAIDCRYAIIGHSERRQFFGETDETVNRRIKAALKQGLRVIFCVGETLQEREKGINFLVVERQVEGGLRDIGETAIQSLVIAYEPVWAIGTGKTATPQQAEEVHQFIRQKMRFLYSPKIADELRIQYGGSVTPDNIKGLMAQEDIDGALVGGASLNADSFSRIVRFKEM